MAGADPGFLKGGGRLGLQAKRGGGRRGSNFGPNVKKPTSWHKRGVWTPWTPWTPPLDPLLHGHLPPEGTLVKKGMCVMLRKTAVADPEVGRRNLVIILYGLRTAMTSDYYDLARPPILKNPGAVSLRATGRPPILLWAKSLRRLSVSRPDSPSLLVEQLPVDPPLNNHVSRGELATDAIYSYPMICR